MTVLIGDIGGTNARFALATVDRPGFTDARTLECALFDTAVDAIRDYISDVGVAKPDVICLAAAGPLQKNEIHITNNHWSLSVNELQRAFNSSAVRLMNDFEAAAYSVPFVRSDERLPIGNFVQTELPDGDFSVAVVGPGTGFGAAGLYRHVGELRTIAGEGGHVGFAPENETQRELVRIMQGRQPRVAIEHFLSGRGIENLFIAISQLRGEPGAQKTAAEVFVAAASDNQSTDFETAQVFFEILGQVAGDMALTYDAHDGVFVAGGIAKRYPDLLQKSNFRRGFEAKGPHEALMQTIPTTLIMHSEPGLLGAAYGALQML